MKIYYLLQILFIMKSGTMVEIKIDIKINGGIEAERDRLM